MRAVTMLHPQNCKTRPPPTPQNGYYQEKTEPFTEEARWNHRTKQEKPETSRLFTFSQEWISQP
jgi:hypothetical protein